MEEKPARAARARRGRRSPRAARSPPPRSRPRRLPPPRPNDDVTYVTPSCVASHSRRVVDPEVGDGQRRSVDASARKTCSRQRSREVGVRGARPGCGPGRAAPAARSRSPRCARNDPEDVASAQGHRRARGRLDAGDGSAHHRGRGRRDQGRGPARTASRASSSRRRATSCRSSPSSRSPPSRRSRPTRS